MVLLFYPVHVARCDVIFLELLFSALELLFSALELLFSALGFVYVVCYRVS